MRLLGGLKSLLTIPQVWRILLVILFGLATPAWSAQLPAAPAKFALVIGNSLYSSSPLANPKNDAELMAGTLKQLGFVVTKVGDLNRKGLYEAIGHFADTIPAGAVSLVYYAGHGMQINHANYLIPVDMVPTSPQGVALKAYPVDALLTRMKQSPASVNLVFLDACRNNPFIASASRTRGFDNMGLAKITSPQGMLVAYSTSPGELAEDGAGAHSIYTQSLASNALLPGLTIEQVLKTVAEDVRKKTIDDQQPWFETSLVDDFYFKPPPGVKQIAARPVRGSSKLALADSRGMSQERPPEWYMTLNETEWQQLDWEITQRVKRFTSDEIPLLTHRAQKGNVIAQTTLGLVYTEGIDKIQESGTNHIYRSHANNSKGIVWLKKAAVAGFPMAQVLLGEMYYQGQGLDRDLNESKRWLSLAAEANYARASLDLAQVKFEQNPSPENMKNMGAALMGGIMKMNQQMVKKIQQ